MVCQNTFKAFKKKWSQVAMQSCEITKNTPVVGLIQSQSRVFVASIKSYLDKQVDIFEDKDILDHVNGEVPVMVYIITLIQVYEKT